MLINIHQIHNYKSEKYMTGSISDKNFEEFIIKFKKNIINFNEWIEKYKLNKLKNEIALTFDDGLLCQYKLALPILNKYNIEAGWGICSAPIENIPIFLEIYKYFQHLYFENDNEFYNMFYNIILSNIDYKNYRKELNNIENINNYRKNLKFYTFNDRKFRYLRDFMANTSDFEKIIKIMMNMKGCNNNLMINKIWINKEQLKKLSETQYICSHSHTHPTTLHKLSYKEQEEEIKESVNIIENIINKIITIFCCPCDNFNKDTINILKKVNIICLAGKDIGNEKYAIQRIDYNEFIK